MATTLFFNAQILTMTQSTPELLLGAVGVVDSKIALVSSSSDEIKAFKAVHPTCRAIDCSGKLLMPGLINGHTHVSMTLQRGMGDDIELMKWLNEVVWPFEARQSDDDIEAGARLGIAEMLLGGTTTFVDMYWSEQRVATAVKKMGIRAVLGECCLVGEKEVSFEENLPKLIAISKSCDRITAAVAPHAPYTCPPEVLSRCVEVAQENSLPIIIHLAETQAESQTIKELYNLTPTEYLDKWSVIKPSTILAHSIYLTDNDIRIIEERGASVAHNPQCNMKISSGVAQIPELLAQGIPCMIGTDGVCSNNDLDMWDEMRTASFLHKLTTNSPTSMPAYEVIKMATTNAAKAIGREGELGIIATGALADIVVLNTTRPHWRPQHNLVSSIIYCAKSSDVEYVMVNGELVVEDYKLVEIDLEAICTDVEQRSKSIIDSMSRS